MVSLTCFNRRFTPKWWMVILSCLFIAVFLRLGFWQLGRAEEKKQMLAVQANFAQKAPIVWKAGEAKPEQYQQLQVVGNYLPQILLFDNQHYQHQFGYHVLNPLQLNDKQVLLIDRGWVAGDINRQLLPEITVPTETQTLTGYAYYPSDNWVLGPAYEEKKNNVTIIERIDTKLIGQFLHKSVYPFIIRLDKDNAQGYVREWSIVAMPAERHYAYALQWFAMALVILILFIALNLKKKYD